MSHTSKIDTKMTNRQAVDAAALTMGIDVREGSHRLYAGDQEGLGLYHDAFHYPVVVGQDGELAFDKFRSDHQAFDRTLVGFRNHYNGELAMIEAQNAGHFAERQVEENGDVTVTVTMGG